MFAASNGHAEVAKELLRAPFVSTNLQDKDGWTALIFACDRNHIAVVELLIEHNCDVNVQTIVSNAVFCFCLKNY